MKWCDKCKHSSQDVVLEDTEELKKRLENLGISKEEFEKRLKELYESLKSRYPVVIFCKKQYTWCVMNPERDTQKVDMSKVCPYFEEKTS